MQAQWAPEWSRWSMGRGTFSKWRRRNSPATFAALQIPDTSLPTIFLSRLHLFLRLVKVHLPVLTRQKVFFIFNFEIIWGRDNCQLTWQVCRRKQYPQTPFWAILTWISAGIKHSCSLGILLMFMLQHRVQHPCKVSIWWILYSMYIKTNLLRMWRGQKRLQDLAKSSKRTVLCFKVKEGRVKEQAVWQNSTCYRPE